MNNFLQEVCPYVYTLHSLYMRAQNRFFPRNSFTSDCQCLRE